MHKIKISLITTNQLYQKAYMTFKKSNLPRQECIKHSYRIKHFIQALTLTFLLFFLSLLTHANCQTANRYSQNYISSSQQSRYQAVSNDGRFFVSSYQNITDHLKVFKTEQSAFSQVANIHLTNTRIKSIKITNEGQKIVYVDQNSYRVKIHQKKLDGSFQDFPDYQIHIAPGPNYIDISADGRLMAVVGSDAFAKIYKSNGKFSQFVLFQTIDVVNQLMDEAITSTSKFLACSFSKNLQTLVLSGQTGEIYVYQLVGTSYVFFQKIPSSAGGSNHAITFSLQLSSDSTTMIAGTSQNFLSFQRSGKGQFFSNPTVYQDCFSYNSSAYVVALTDDGDKFYASCYYRSPTHIFQRPKNSSSVFTLSYTIPTIDVFSISLSGQGAYLVIGDAEATYFKVYQYFCGNGSYLSLQGNCQACNKIKCNKCSRFSSDKCFQCQGNQTLIANSCQCSNQDETCMPNTQDIKAKDSQTTLIISIAISVPLGIAIIIIAGCLMAKYIRPEQENDNILNQTKQVINEDLAEQPKDKFQMSNQKQMRKQNQYFSANDSKIMRKQNQYFSANDSKIMRKQNQYFSANDSKIMRKQNQYFSANDSKIMRKQNQQHHVDLNSQQIYQIYSQICSICKRKGVTHFTPCLHYFHVDCIKFYIDKYRKCPNCQYQLNAKDISQWNRKRIQKTS